MPNLTDISIKNLPIPEKGQKSYWDRGLGVRVSQGGSKTFIVMFGNGRRKSIGRYPTISLAQARTEAKRILAAKTLGHQPTPTTTFLQLYDLFFSVQCTPERNKERTIHDYKRHISKHFLPRFRHQKLSDISTDDIQAVLLSLSDTPSEASHALTVARIIFHFAKRRNLLKRNPCDGIDTPQKTRKRSRVLSDNELTAVYTTARELKNRFGYIVLILIHTGQRRSEIANLKWEWITEETITLPAFITKNSEEHTFPNTIQNILETIPRT